MNTPRELPRLLLFGLFLSLTLICPPENRIFTPKYSFLSVGLHLAIKDTFLSRSRGLFLAVVNRYSHRFTLECHLLPMYFLSTGAPHRTDYSQSGGDKKMHFTMVNFFPKKLSRNQSINQFIHVNTWDGVTPIIQAKGSCMKRMTRQASKAMLNG